MFFFSFFFFHDTATTEIYTLSLHDALPISGDLRVADLDANQHRHDRQRCRADPGSFPGRPGNDPRSEEHTSELQSQSNLVCRLLLEKKKKKKQKTKYGRGVYNVGRSIGIGQ